jgi:hypothetical protein
MTPTATATPSGIVFDLPTGWGRTAFGWAIKFASLLPALVPAAWLLGGLYLLDHFPPPRAWREVVQVLVVAPCAAACIVWVLFFPHTLERWLSRGWLAAVARRRADAVVDPDDPDALFVRLLPREAWTWPTSRDLHFGFLLVEPESGLVLFEGDDRRFVLPAGSVTATGMEEFRVATGGSGYVVRTSFALVEARVDGLNTPWVTALCVWPGGLRWVLAELRSPAALGLRDRIAAVVQAPAAGGDYEPRD